MTAIVKEMKQIHDMGVISPLHTTADQQRQVLQYILFLKEKKNRSDLWERMRQQLTVTENHAEGGSIIRTPSTDSVVITSLRNARERRYITITDIPGAFLQYDAEGVVILRIEGSMVQALLKIELQLYREQVVLNNEKKVIYVQIRKALYGLLYNGLIV